MTRGSLLDKAAAIICLILFASISAVRAGDSDVSLDQPLEQTRKAAIAALETLGFDLKRQDACYLEGYRPRKAGYVYGSGGEIVGIWIKEVGVDRTKVLIETAKSTIGYSGQKDWADDILREMHRQCGGRE